jgi:hypothetical protein
MKMRELVSFFMLFALAVGGILYKDVKAEKEDKQCQKQEIEYKI